MRSTRRRLAFWGIALVISVTDLALTLTPGSSVGQPASAPWNRHTIDNTSKGADGVRLADVNRDGLLDITTGWEQGGVVRVYVNPGPAKAKERWPAVTVGKVAAPEDAVFADLDGDGAVDVVSCCEGNTKSVFVHWAPKDKNKYLDPKEWQTEPIPVLMGTQMFMFCLPLQVDGKHGIDLVIGAKGPGAQVGWLEAPANPRDLAGWKWHPLYQAGWIMSLAAHDIDGDGDLDILASDRKGKTSGVLWLENPGASDAQAQPWKAHRIGPTGQEVMFLDLADLDKDGLLDIVVPVHGRRVWFHRRKAGSPPMWESLTLPAPGPLGNGKAGRVADINLDGKPDVILTSEGTPTQSGIVWMSYRKTPADADWDIHDITGPTGGNGLKLDIIQLVDLDGDGDLDIITTDERSSLGVIWWENPTK